MTSEKAILTIYIGETDIYEWTMAEGKRIIMPELLIGCEELLYNELESVKCLRVEAFIRGDNKAFDFFVKRNEIEDTLSKIMDWAHAEEEYEVCERVKNLNEYLENNQF